MTVNFTCRGDCIGTCVQVCLSLLGTWAGPSWSAALSVSSLVLSIQVSFQLLCSANKRSEFVERHLRKQHLESLFGTHLNFRTYFLTVYMSKKHLLEKNLCNCF